MEPMSWIVVIVVGLMVAYLALDFLADRSDKRRGERVYREYTRWKQERAKGSSESATSKENPPPKLG